MPQRDRRPRRRRPARVARDAGPRGPADGAAGASSPHTRRTTAGRSGRRRRSPTCGAALGPTDIVVSDVGAHKIWVARLYQAYEPNTVIISNGFAADGHRRCPARSPPSSSTPTRRVVALCGDGGFLMNSRSSRRRPDRRRNHRRRLARRRLRAHRLEAAQRVRPAVRGRVRRTRTSSAYAQSFGIAGVPALHRRPICYPTLMRALDVTTARRSSTCRSTTARTCG